MQPHDNTLLQKKQIDAKINRHLATTDKGEWDKAGRTNTQSYL